MSKSVYTPAGSRDRMAIVCFVSGSGTNYREIVRRDPKHTYLVFTNRPGCGGALLARQNGHEVIELIQAPFLREAKKRHPAGNFPRNSPERQIYEQEICRLVEGRLGRQPDLLCLAGYDQWLTDWMVDRYYPRILNVHPGDTTKGYDGLHWIPAARAILSGESDLRSTLFFVDRGEDTGPVLVQSGPLDIHKTLKELGSNQDDSMLERLDRIKDLARVEGLRAYQDFKSRAPKQVFDDLEMICSRLQEALKVAGDWKIYPFAVHDLIARGRVRLEGSKVLIDGHELPEYGYRMDSRENSAFDA
jgi:phosphoribosylglycinamide formyltransferase 1